jgi:hypothetical protein
VNADGLVACEGSDVNGMLGFPTNTVATCSYDCTSLLSTTTEYCGYPCQQALSNVPGLAPAVRVSAPAGPCALGGDGAVQCWGGEDSQGNLVAPYTVALPGAALRIAGGQGACALLQTGALACWDGPIDAAGCPPSGCALPAIVPDLDDLTDLSIAIGHGCVVRADGTAFCWGTSTAGELGDGTNTNRATPVQVSGPLKLTGISTDFAVTWAITDGGGIATWGVSVAPPGVDGTSECDGIACRVEPVAVPGISNVKQVSSGGGGLGYALLVDGSVLQIDENEHGFVLTQVAP